MRVLSSLTLLLGILSAFGQIRYYDCHKDNGFDPNETSIAIDPNNSENIIAASNINNVYYTTDTGKTWTQNKATSDLGVYGDPVLHYSGSGLFYTHLSQTKGKKYKDWFDRIVVQKVNDPMNWGETSYSVGYNDDKMQDKPWMSSDETQGPYRGSVYVTWTEFDAYESQNPDDRSRIRFSSLAPGAGQFSDAITISDTTGDCLDDDNTLEGAVTAVGMNGEIFCVWSGHNALWFDKSMDGGKTWGTDKRLASHVEGWNMVMPNIFRANGMPFICTDPKTNTIFICWADEWGGDANIWLIFSTDGGESWSNRVKMNQDNGKAAQYFPNMVFNELTSEVMICYYDQRNSPNGYFYDIYMSTFSTSMQVKDYRITPQSIPLPGTSVFFGDYIDMDSRNGVHAIVYPIYEGFSSDIRVAVFKDKDLPAPAVESYVIPGLVINKETINLVVNNNSPYTLKAKLKYGGINHKLSFESDETGEEAIWTDVTGSGLSVFKLKMVIRDEKTGRKTRIKSKKLMFL